MYSTRQKLAMYFGSERSASSRYADSRYSDSHYADSHYADSHYAEDLDELDYDSDLMAAAPEGCGTSGKSRFTKVTNPANKSFKGVSSTYGNYKKHHEYGQTGFGTSGTDAYKKKYNEWYMENVFDGNC